MKACFHVIVASVSGNREAKVPNNVSTYQQQSKKVREYITFLVWLLVGRHVFGDLRLCTPIYSVTTRLSILGHG